MPSQIDHTIMPGPKTMTRLSNSVGTIVSIPATPRTTPRMFSARFNWPVRSAATLSSSTHRLPTNSLPLVMPFSTDCSAAHAVTAWAGSVPYSPATTPMLRSMRLPLAMIRPAQIRPKAVAMGASAGEPSFNRSYSASTMITSVMADPQ